ncbi:hypothetical protein [Microbacterium sp. Root1433D1]|uniref:hypothetical protein n=1 Tax=Microbacterium sp. Root1433D1 TaxID=1736463 RepID=UPI000A6893A0|nr:hypothetical protein [Microbacterium sp. Root1433D1]
MNSPRVNIVETEHIEYFTGDAIHTEVPVLCQCEIGHDHSYADWIERFQKNADASVS